jgi:branched-subunit amino acid ABC-type transport system permease component
VLEPSFLVGQALSGLTAAMFLFVVASGLSLVFGVLRVLNFAHGSFYMLGAYLSWQITQWLGAATGSFWLSVLGAALGVAILGGVVERLLLRHLYGREDLYQLLLTYALVLILGDGARILWGTQQLAMPRPAGLTGSFELFGAVVPYYNFFIILLGPAIAIACWLASSRTGVGRMIRAPPRSRDARRPRRRRGPALHADVHGRLLPRRPRRRARDPGAQHRARHGRRDHRRGVHRGSDWRARLVLGHFPRRDHLRAGARLRHPDPAGFSIFAVFALMAIVLIARPAGPP